MRLTHTELITNFVEKVNCFKNILFYCEDFNTVGVLKSIRLSFGGRKLHRKTKPKKVCHYGDCVVHAWGNFQFLRRIAINEHKAPTFDKHGGRFSHTHQ